MNYAHIELEYLGMVDHRAERGLYSWTDALGDLFQYFVRLCLQLHPSMAPGPLMQNSHDEQLSDLMTSIHFICGPMTKKEATKMAVEHRLKT
jgi:hypothetical protein